MSIWVARTNLCADCKDCQHHSWLEFQAESIIQKRNLKVHHSYPTLSSIAVKLQGLLSEGTPGLPVWALWRTLAMRRELWAEETDF